MPSSSGHQKLQDKLQRAAIGDETAWRWLVDTYTPRVFGLIRAQCGNADLSEEITQATFAKVAAKLSSYAEEGKFEAWIFRIAMNLLRDEKRREGRQARPVEDETLQGLAGADAGMLIPGQDEGDEQSLALEKALGQLPEADRRIIHLRYRGGLSFKQIADVLSQPMGTVLARHHRALKKLRDLMEGAD